MLRKLLIVIVFLISSLPLAVIAQSASTQSPVGIPFFHMADGSTNIAGKAFGIQWFHNRKLLLMPLHLLGPSGGYPTYVLPQNVPEAVSSVDVMSLSEDRIIDTAKPGLLRKGSPVEKNSGNLTDDLMAFELPYNCSLPLLPLCPTLVPVGTKVWVLSKVKPASDNSPDKFSGKVVSASPSGIRVALDSPLTALASSGSPIVDAQNQVVAMLVGTNGGNRTSVSGAPSISIYKRLLRELGQ
jgi:hypothetical protein